MRGKSSVAPTSSSSAAFAAADSKNPFAENLQYVEERQSLLGDFLENDRSASSRPASNQLLTRAKRTLQETLQMGEIVGQVLTRDGERIAENDSRVRYVDGVLRQQAETFLKRIQINECCLASVLPSVVLMILFFFGFIIVRIVKYYLPHSDIKVEPPKIASLASSASSQTGWSTIVQYLALAFVGMLCL